MVSANHALSNRPGRQPATGRQPDDNRTATRTATGRQPEWRRHQLRINWSNGKIKRAARATQ